MNRAASWPRRRCLNAWPRRRCLNAWLRAAACAWLALLAAGCNNGPAPDETAPGEIATSGTAAGGALSDNSASADSASSNGASSNSAPSNSAPDAAAVGDSGPSTAGDARPGGGALDLALLAPLPEFVDPARDRAAPGNVPSGHVAAHGELDEPTPETALSFDAVAIAWSALSAPNYVAPALMGTAERPPLEQVVDASVLAASGRRVVLDGFGTVDRRAGAAVVELMLTPLPLSCCLGGFPDAGGRVHVRIDPAIGLEVDPWTPLRLVGRFDVEERRDALGLFEGLYFLAVDGAPDAGALGH